jgi:hypothetical protein
MATLDIEAVRNPFSAPPYKFFALVRKYGKTLLTKQQENILDVPANSS